MALPLSPDNDEFSRNLFQDIFKLYIEPEIERRKKGGKINNDFILTKAQITFNPDKKENIVKLNDEVYANAYIKPKKGVLKQYGEPVFEDEVEDLNDIYPAKEEDQDLGHITIIKFKNYYYLSFDFRYNKKLASKYIKKAKEFLDSAVFSLSVKKWAPFIDNLYSSLELAIKAILLTFPDPKFKKKSSHKDIKIRFNMLSQSLHIDPVYQVCFKELSELRPKARYAEPDFILLEPKAQQYLELVGKFIAEAEERIKIKK
jgi:HEPN domain-containing protein